MLQHKASGRVDVDIPDEREYNTPSDVELDEALVEAIQKAKEADNDYLSNLLEHELGSFYLRQRASK